MRKTLLACGVVLLALLAPFFLVPALLPFPELDAYRARPCSTVLTDRNGLVLRVSPLADGLKREWAPLERIPEGSVRIFIQAEDRRFYFHPGIDPLAILRSAWQNARSGRVVSGASTISMQLARLVKPHGSGLGGKLGEAWDALRVEARLSKRDILELWLNGIPFGGNVEGLPAMARSRFGRAVEELDDTRAALLAVVPRRPALYDPARDPAASAEAAYQLARRAKLGLSEVSLLEAAEDAHALSLSGGTALFKAPHFTTRILSEIVSSGWHGTNATTIQTTLELELQTYAEELLGIGLEPLRERRVSTGAVLAIDNATGEVLVYVGSADWNDAGSGGQIDGIRVENQPGSCLKPFLYALAFDKGFLPNEILPDIPTVFGGREAYIPSNFNRRFNGPVRIRVALASSLNIPAVYLLERLGVRNFEDYLVSLGFGSVAKTRGTHGTGLALGNAEVSLEELVRAFSAFPRGGSVPVLRFLAAGNHEALSPPAAATPAPAPAAPTTPAPAPRMSAWAAWTVADILSDKASRFVGFGGAPSMKTPFPAMFKTGTANQFQHIWALGATSRFTVGVWMGNFSGETIVGKTGSSTPAALAAELLKALEESRGTGDLAGSGGRTLAGDGPARNALAGNTPAGEPPANTVSVELCPLSGMKVTASCTGTVMERLPRDRMPSACDWHRGSHLVYPPEYRSWLLGRRRAGTSPEPSSQATITRPAAGSLFWLDASFPSDAQGLRLETSGFASGASVHMDDAFIGVLDDAGSLLLPLTRGRRTLFVEDDRGVYARTDFEVR